MDIGFGAKASLKRVQVSELLRLNFQRNCIKFLTATTAKIIEKSPVRHQMVCRLSCLDPEIMTEQPKGASKMFGNVLSTLQEAKWLNDESCDLAKQQYENFCVSEKKALGQFHWDSDWLDSLFYRLLFNRASYNKLWAAVQLRLVFCHGQACIERGFNQNKEILDTNMGKDTVTALRIAQESVRAEGGRTNVKISKEMLKSCRASRHRYDEYIQSNKERAERERKMKRKAKFEAETEEIQKKKKKKLEEAVTSFDQES